MTIETALQDTRRQIGALDFTAENARISAIDVQLAQIEAAQQRARERREEVLQLLRPFNAAHHLASSPVLNETDGRTIADALLAGKDTSEAAEQRLTRDKLERERDALRDGLTDLARRERELRQERDDIKSGAARSTLDQLRPLCEAYEEEAREGARMILRSFAALTSLGNVSRSNPPGLHATAAAVPGLRGGDKLMRAGESIDVPGEVLALVELLAEKGPAQIGRVRKSVEEPPLQVTAALVTPHAAPTADNRDRGWRPFGRAKRPA